LNVELLNCREAWNFGTLGTCGSLNALNGAKRLRPTGTVGTDLKVTLNVEPLNGRKALNDWNWLSVFVRDLFRRKNLL
jgi:hypothetical protein